MLLKAATLQPKKQLSRTDVAEMAVAPLRRCGVEDQSGTRANGPQALRADLRRVPSRAGRRSRVRREFPDQSVWALSAGRPSATERFLNEVQKSARGMGTDLAQANVLATRRVQVPGFLKLDPTQRPQRLVEVQDLPDVSSTDMPFSLGLMMLVDIVSRKGMDDREDRPEQFRISGGVSARTVPIPIRSRRRQARAAAWYRARPLNGVWATAPYLHNGSVPSLYWMLTSRSRASPDQFCMGASRLRSEAGRLRGRRRRERARPGRRGSRRERRMARADQGNSVLGHSFDGTPGPEKRTA